MIGDRQEIDPETGMLRRTDNALGLMQWLARLCGLHAIRRRLSPAQRAKWEDRLVPGLPLTTGALMIGLGLLLEFAVLPTGGAWIGRVVWGLGVVLAGLVAVLGIRLGIYAMVGPVLRRAVGSEQRGNMFVVVIAAAGFCGFCWYYDAAVAPLAGWVVAGVVLLSGLPGVVSSPLLLVWGAAIMGLLGYLLAVVFLFAGHGWQAGLVGLAVGVAVLLLRLRISSSAR